VLDRLKARVAFFVISLIVAAFTLTVVTIALCVGLFFLYAQYVSPAMAAFLLAATAIVLAVFVLLLSRLMLGARRRRREDSSNRAAMALGAELGGELFKLFGSGTPAILAFSLAAGFVVGLSPRLRAFLFDLARS
jgi:hypothetical protein